MTIWRNGISNKGWIHLQTECIIFKICPFSSSEYFICISSFFDAIHYLLLASFALSARGRKKLTAALTIILDPMKIKEYSSFPSVPYRYPAKIGPHRLVTAWNMNIIHKRYIYKMYSFFGGNVRLICFQHYFSIK